MLPVNPSTTRQTPVIVGNTRQPVSPYLYRAAGVRVRSSNCDCSRGMSEYLKVTESRRAVFRETCHGVRQTPALQELTRIPVSCCFGQSRRRAAVPALLCGLGRAGESGLRVYNPPLTRAFTGHPERTRVFCTVTRPFCTTKDRYFMPERVGDPTGNPLSPPPITSFGTPSRRYS